MKMWSMPICLKSTTSSVRDFMACSTFSNFAFKVMLALLQTFQHRPRYVLSLLAQHFEVFLHRVKLRLQDALLQLRRLRILPNWSCDMMTQS